MGTKDQAVRLRPAAFQWHDPRRGRWATALHDTGGVMRAKFVTRTAVKLRPVAAPHRQGAEVAR